MHCVLGHCSLDHLLETLAKTKNMRVGVITRADVDAFRAEGCALCTIWLMRTAPVKNLTDPSRAPPGKKWSFDTMHLQKASPEGFLYITRFYDDGTHYKKSYGHARMTTDVFTSAACSSSAPTNPVEKSKSAGVKTRAMARASARDREGRSGECRDIYRW